MNKIETLADLVYRTVEESPKERAEIADDCGDLYSMFSRKINPNDNVRFPADQIAPLIRSTRDPRVLEFIVSKTSDVTGLILVKDRPRKVMADPRDYAHTMTVITDFQRALGNWLEAKAAADEVMSKIDKLRSELLAVRKAIQTNNKQKDLFDNKR